MTLMYVQVIFMLLLDSDCSGHPCMGHSGQEQLHVCVFGFDKVASLGARNCSFRAGMQLCCL